MKPRLALLIPAAGAAAGLISACSTTSPAEPSDAPAPRVARPSHRIAQVGFGADARFVSCLDPACPQVTLKTIAHPLAASAAAAIGSHAAALPSPANHHGSSR